MGRVTAAEWAAKGRAAAEAEAVELTLPSGATILARRPSAEQLLSWGYMPMGLAAAAAEGVADPTRVTNEDVVRYATMYREVLVYCCVQPRIALNPAGPDEISPAAIPECDWTYLFRWATRQEAAERLRSFRGKPEAAGSGGDGADVRAEAERADVDRGPGDGVGDRPGGGGGAGIRVVGIG